MAEAKQKEVLEVQMEDGRTVAFVGKRKVLKETLIDESKISVEGDGSVLIGAGAVAVRMDFRNGATRTFPVPGALIARFAGHGMEQKYGDELAAPADKPLSEEDMVLAVEDLDSRIQKGDWRVVREGGGGVSGAGIVVRALMEATGKDAAFIKSFLDKKIESTPGLTRQKLYASFRTPGTKTGDIIARMEAEKGPKAPAVNADEVLGEMA